jgi:hydroxyacylglutathione hydrolase
MLQVEVIETGELGDRSYVAHDGSTAVVIDPQRDLDRVQSLLDDHGLTVAAVAETHIHNDYVTGGFELARQTGADYLVCADDPVRFARRPVADGDTLTYGTLTLRTVATPGHTHTHLAYAVTAADDEDGRVAVFTGGSLLYGSVGRTDLLGSQYTDELTRAQFHSARRLLSLFPETAEVFPTHGFGSFCSSGSAAGGESSTLGQEKERNDALTEHDEDAFVARLVANLTAYPAYYAHMAPRNIAGPGPADLSPPEPVDTDQLHKRIDAGEWVVDLRNRTLYSAGHLPGTIGIELGQQFATYLGWLMPWDTPLTLVGESQEQVADAQRQLVRIGIERPDGAAVGDVESMADGGTLAAYPRRTFADLRSQVLGKADAAAVVLDVRRDDERAEGGIPGSTHIPMHSLLERLDDVPPGTAWVHCASGFRASIAASLLQRAGRDVVLVDDEYEQARRLGLTDDPS